MMVTIKQVAQAAGVSPTTASYALNDRPEVKEETKRRVREAAERIHYVPNRAAQTFRRGKTHTIAVMTGEDIENGNTFTAEFFGVLACARQKHYDVLVLLVGSQEQSERDVAKVMGHMMCDGYLLLGNQLDHIARYIVKNGLKGVLLSSHTQEPISQVNADGRLWMGRMTELVLQSGRKNPFYLTYGLGEREEQLRAQGFEEALARAGISDAAGRILRTASGNLGQSLKAARQAGCDALVCWNDRLGIQAITALEALGLQVPRDVAVTGFDDNDFMTGLNFALTTVRQPFAQKGRVAAQMLIDLVEKGAQEPENRFVECSIVKRATL